MGRFNISPEIMNFHACRCLLKILKHDFMQKMVTCNTDIAYGTKFTGFCSL